mgnify:CR=1 FL=1
MAKATEGETVVGDGSGRRLGLDRREVLAVALGMVEREGAGALTMRRLAAELDVTTTTIYWHVGGRDELVAGVVELAASAQAVVELDDADQHDRIVALARGVYEGALTHRNVTSLAHQEGLSARFELQLELAMARELQAAGLAGTQVRDAVRAISMCVAGFLVVALQSQERVPPERRSEALWTEVDAPDLKTETTAALTQAPDLDDLLTRTLRSIVAGVLDPSS